MNINYIPYNKKLNERARKLRNNSTLAEVILWNELKAGKIKGYKFNRQKPLGNYIADFYCKKLNLIIEIDGISHIGNELKDIRRQVHLEGFKLNFLRFDDAEIKESLPYVIQKIETYISNFEQG